MRSAASDFFTIDIQSIISGSVLPFPTYIHLKLNDRFAPYSSIASEFEAAKKLKLIKYQHSLLVPEAYRKDYLLYLEKFAEQLNPHLHHTEVPHTSLVAKALEADLEKEVKIALMSTFAKDAIEKFQNINFSKIKEKEELFLSKINTTFNEILLEAGKEEHFYLEVLAMKRLKSPLDYSLFSALLALVFAMSMGKEDVAELAAIGSAALLRDIGVNDFNFSEFPSNQGSWSEKVIAYFTRHIKNSLGQSKLFSKKYPAQVLLYIEQHHERYDGRGYPAKKWHHQIELNSQIIHLADIVSLKVKGLDDGISYTVKEAVRSLVEDPNNAEGHTAINPEIIHRALVKFQHKNAA